MTVRAVSHYRKLQSATALGPIAVLLPYMCTDYYDDSIELVLQ